ncbi:ATP-dependent helicase [Alcaligenes sp. SMD-FA]|uniref:ATP-dependent helicase n=1 Tax=Alcaligenes sp. SMD-FA TaxID=2991054 RepID=UPI002225D42C|nr:ATP-dependent helicase [Alcaligenes sp. SMD-FA]UYY85583.1 ATP-dependent helicase [Alcaligenes sp. SMD-FA]
MAKLELDLFGPTRASVMAPAGCGKTQLIADTLKVYGGLKPVLVLTHTNAGRGALEARLERAGVTRSNYRVFTIDGWAGQLISKFPVRSRCNPQILRHENPKVDYPAIRVAAWQLLESGDILDVLAATYSRLIVDEYQDCSLPQHNIVNAIAHTLPTCVLGDPLQAIFGFREPTVDWDTHVRAAFPQLGVMGTPWRWKKVEAEALGRWLLDIRQPLFEGQSLDLGSAPAEVQHVLLVGTPAMMHLKRMEAARTKAPNKDGTVLVIGDSKNPKSQRKIASVVHGASTVEALDLRDLTDFARTFDPALTDSTRHLVEFAAEMMTNLGGAELQRRLMSLRGGTAKKEANAIETACLVYGGAPSYSAAVTLLEKLEANPEVRVYRHEVLHVLKSSLRIASRGNCSFYEATVQAREINRHLSRRTGRVAVGSTLLLKGLEADVAVVLDPSEMDAKHLYVALTRGARKLVVCSPTSVITPRAKS